MGSCGQTGTMRAQLWRAGHTCATLEHVKSPAKRNLTLSLPATLIRSAKVLAAKRGTSVNALVRESLEGMVRSEDTVQDALQRILSSAAEGLYQTTRKVSREELYDR